MNIAMNYGWVCPKCGRVYAPNQAMCLYCGEGSISKQSDSVQPYTPEQDFIWPTNKIKDLTTITTNTTTLNGVSNYAVKSSEVDTSISCSAYRNEECLATKEPFITSCKGEKEKCENEYGPC